VIFTFYCTKLFEEISLFKKRIIFIVCMLGNLLPLIYYKYLSFFKALSFFPFECQCSLGSTELLNQDLPLGISFFTFQQIGYLILSYKCKVNLPKINEYFSFIILFPQLIAGPIADPRKLIPQFKRLIKPKEKIKIMISAGITVFSIGLFKKVILADSLGKLANKYFSVASANKAEINFVDSLYGSVSYTFQLYFDFSGYSDMAIGLGLLFGLKLPLNFYSPLKSLSIIDFWRRWHITLGRFFNDFLFLPFSLLLLRPLSKFGKLGLSLIPIFEIIPILFTFTLLGLWHGAAFTFIIFGFFHGTGLVICNLYSKTFNIKLPPIFSWFITFIFVVVGFVVFRSSNLTTLKNFILSFLNINQVFDGTLDINPYLYNFNDLILIFFSGMIIFLLPTTVQLVPRYIDLSFIAYRKNIFTNNFKWRPNFYWGFFTAIIFLASLFKLGSPQTFLYFQF